jgi:hypothetical protein
VPERKERVAPVKTAADIQRDQEKNAAMDLAKQKGIETGVVISSDGKASSFAKMAGMEMITYQGGGMSWTASVYNKGSVVTIDYNRFSQWMDNAPKEIERLLNGKPKSPVLLELDGSVHSARTGEFLGKIEGIPEVGSRSHSGATTRAFVGHPNALPQGLKADLQARMGSDITWAPAPK